MFRIAPDHFRCSVEELYERTDCDMPKWVMDRMKKNFEPVKNIYDVIGYPEWYWRGY
uniref:Uncharacterized protein n=1 Tax=Anguilla anguilla TaxID=7936 RepID=A0A0E9XXR8_ANGAN